MYFDNVKMYPKTKSKSEKIKRYRYPKPKTEKIFSVSKFALFWTGATENNLLLPQTITAPFDHLSNHFAQYIIITYHIIIICNARCINTHIDPGGPPVQRLGKMAKNINQRFIIILHTSYIIMLYIMLSVTNMKPFVITIIVIII